MPEKVADYYGRKWRGLESDALWAVQELRTKGFVALRDVVPKDEVVALRTKAEDSWCAVANALHERNMSRSASNVSFMGTASRRWRGAPEI